MNKFFAAVALAALALTGCIKEDDTWKEMQPVKQGIVIQQFTVDQNNIASQPANAGVRLAMLLAEAKKQFPDQYTQPDFDLKTVKVENRVVQDLLFGSGVQIERLTEGDYKIVYTEYAQMFGGSYLEGTLLVETHGREQLSETHGSAWNITMNDFKIRSQTNDGATSTLQYESGSTSLYADGEGSYVVDLVSIRAYVETTNASSPTFYSDWNGSFTLTPADASLAYSLCAGKEYAVSGSASGPSVYTFDGSTELTMSYELENVIYKGTMLASGKQTCRFPNIFEYDLTQFPDDTVVVEWIYTDRPRPTYNYNGYTYTPKN